MSKGLKAILRSKSIKVGVNTSQDGDTAETLKVNAQSLGHNQFARKRGIKCGVQNLAALIAKIRISKISANVQIEGVFRSAMHQARYAATDAWVCLENLANHSSVPNLNQPWAITNYLGWSLGQCFALDVCIAVSRCHGFRAHIYFHETSVSPWNRSNGTLNLLKDCCYHLNEISLFLAVVGLLSLAICVNSKIRIYGIGAMLGLGMWTLTMEHSVCCALVYCSGCFGFRGLGSIKF